MKTWSHEIMVTCYHAQVALSVSGSPIKPHLLGNVPTRLKSAAVLAAVKDKPFGKRAFAAFLDRRCARGAFHSVGRDESMGFSRTNKSMTGSRHGAGGQGFFPGPAQHHLLQQAR